MSVRKFIMVALVWLGFNAMIINAEDSIESNQAVDIKSLRFYTKSEFRF